VTEASATPKDAGSVDAPVVQSTTAQPTVAAKAKSAQNEHAAIFGLLVVSFALRLFRINELPQGLIGDESWYVQAARVILGLPLASLQNLPAKALSGIDPNTEHPALAKVIMAAFIRVLGDHGGAWRLPSVLLGTFSIWLIYLVVQKLGGTPRQAFIAAFLLAFENLSFIHGRIGMLDVYMTTCILGGALLYLSEYFELAGVVFGLGALCKFNAVLGLGAMFTYDVLLARRQLLRPSWKAIRPRLVTALFCGAFFLAGLGTLDGFWSEYTGPLAHLSHMGEYHASLQHTGVPTGTESTPFQWWMNGGVINYYNRTWTEKDVTRIIVFRAAMNEFILFSAPLALFVAAQRTWAGTSRLGAFAVAWVFANFGPVFLLWAIHSRTSYIYYMEPVIPAFVCALALVSEAVPRSIQWAFAGTVLYAFFYSFPFQYVF
jgi:predicted membrane-bound dolichyl-phosphate-mannose-protein mannosyltransferase